MKRIIAILLLLPVLAFAQPQHDSLISNHDLLVFDNTPFKTIIYTLCKRYRYDAWYIGDVPNRSFYGAFGRNEALSSILKVIQKQTGIRCKIKGRVIIIKPAKI